MRESKDIWFNAFLLSKGEPLSTFKMIDHRRVVCFFDITDQKWIDYKVEFQNSEIIKFKRYLDQIKEMGF